MKSMCMFVAALVWLTAPAFAQRGFNSGTLYEGQFIVVHHGIMRLYYLSKEAKVRVEKGEAREGWFFLSDSRPLREGVIYPRFGPIPGSKKIGRPIYK